MTAILTYKGHSLFECPNGYRSTIDGEVLRFDTAGMWKQYIDKYENSRKKNGSRPR